MTSPAEFWLTLIAVCLVTSVFGAILADFILFLLLGNGDEGRRLEEQIDRLYDLAEKKSFDQWQK